ncbi:hypothetical protein DPMN_091310 [Dreissena polymorpha]|uniref:Uncharacterized protein n=1 Tax=Dreissena polymorpha TaxID=45954 RepID=A0A9D4R0L4_DREPO|nr:hypothetical protein DPMN_091310 [Dreissena polymorpha]
MYQDTSGGWTVTSCAPSPDEATIYVANWRKNQLVILSRDGKVMSTFTDPLLHWSFEEDCYPGIHVTDSGQVLLCGAMTNPIIQVDKVGRQRLAEVVTKKDGATNPLSVYYSKHRGSLIVGMGDTKGIIVFKAKFKTL